MKEVLYRRLYKIVTEKDYIPDLIILDGGINQIKVAKEVVSELGLNIPIASLLKNEKHITKALLNSDYKENKIR